MRNLLLFFTLLALLITGCATQQKSVSLTNKPDSGIENKIVEIHQALDKADKSLKLGSDKEQYYQRDLNKAESIFNEIKSAPSYNSFKYSPEVVDMRIRLNETKLKVDKTEKQLSSSIQLKLDTVNQNLDSLGKYIARNSLKTDKELDVLKKNWYELENSDGFDVNQSKIAKAKQRMLYFENKINGSEGKRLVLENIKININILHSNLSKCEISIKDNDLLKAKSEFKIIQKNWHKLELSDGFDITGPKVLKLKKSIQKAKDQLNLLDR